MTEKAKRTLEAIRMMPRYELICQAMAQLPDAVSSRLSELADRSILPNDLWLADEKILAQLPSYISSKLSELVGKKHLFGYDEVRDSLIRAVIILIIMDDKITSPLAQWLNEIEFEMEGNITPAHYTFLIPSSLEISRGLSPSEKADIRSWHEAMDLPEDINWRWVNRLYEEAEPATSFGDAGLSPLAALYNVDAVSDLSQKENFHCTLAFIHNLKEAYSKLFPGKERELEIQRYLALLKGITGALGWPALPEAADNSKAFRWRLANLYNQAAHILIQDLASPDPAVSTQAQERLLTVSSPLTAPLMTRFMKYGDREFRVRAARILSERWEKIALEGIMLWYEDEMKKQSELNPTYIKELIQALTKLGHVRALFPLVHRLITGRAGRPPGCPLPAEIQAALAQAIENIIRNAIP